MDQQQSLKVCPRTSHINENVNRTMVSHINDVMHRKKKVYASGTWLCKWCALPPPLILTFVFSLVSSTKLVWSEWDKDQTKEQVFQVKKTWGCRPNSNYLPASIMLGEGITHVQNTHVNCKVCRHTKHVHEVVCAHAHIHTHTHTAHRHAPVTDTLCIHSKYLQTHWKHTMEKQTHSKQGLSVVP